jgi:hypothetical protein
MNANLSAYPVDTTRSRRVERRRPSGSGWFRAAVRYRRQRRATA